MKHLHLLEKLLAIDSPSGFTGNAEEFIVSTMKSIGYETRKTNKGAVICQLGSKPTLGFAAHTDTLGAIVSKLNSNGTLGFSLIGGPLLPSFEGSYVRIYTLNGKVYTGTILFNNPSAHANKQSAKTERTTDVMHIRIDELVDNAAMIGELGIGIGDIVAFDTKYTALDNGFIKSHFLDNKAGCFVLFLIALQVKEMGIEPPVELFFSNYEEVGHGGACGFSPSVTDLLVIDMGVVGDQLDGRENKCSICAKDSSGPYDYGFRKTLVELARTNSIPHAVDVYPFYSSDGTAALRAGLDARVALIGPGVAASHGMERTHVDGIQATVDLCMSFIKHHFN